MSAGFKLKFIGIGAYKSGTTWLVQCLREHPNICVPRIKEVDFFSKKYIDGKYSFSHFDKGLKWYQEQFSECDAGANCWGEFSNSYLYDKDVPKRVKKAFPNIKLLLCLRNPVDRTYSGYLWDKLNFKREKFEGFNINDIKKGDYINQSLYGKYIGNYLKVFKKEDIHVVLYDDIKNNPKEVIEKTYSFLGLNKFNPPSLKKIINPASHSRSRMLTYVFDLRIKLEEKNLGRIIDFLKKIKIYHLIQELYVTINRKPLTVKPLTIKERNKLRKMFLEDITVTEKLLRIDLSAWR